VNQDAGSVLVAASMLLQGINRGCSAMDDPFSF
jgi:hypothetical protein